MIMIFAQMNLNKGLYAILLCTLISTFYDLSEDSKIFNVVNQSQTVCAQNIPQFPIQFQ